MTIEAQKLISMSLGKIAASRQQRGGVNLHKSLLVSKILIKARNAAIAASHSRISDTKLKVKRKIIGDNEARNSKLTKINDKASNTAGTHESRDQAKPENSNKENSPPVVTDTEPNGALDVQSSAEIENVPQDSNNKDNNITKKRRNSECTEIDQAVESISPSKKTRTEQSYAVEETPPSAITVSQQQISNLVTIFNSGLTSLTNAEVPDDNSLDDKKETNSCFNATHIKNVLSHLAHPVLAVSAI